jgi:septal ring factor EnvC (AmiA/AmiB activator)
MSDQDNYEGIDFRVRGVPKPRAPLPFVWWTIAGIALVSLILLGVQFWESSSQRQLIQHLQSERQIEAQRLEDANRRNQDIQNQLNQSHADLNQVKQELSSIKQELSNCKNRKPPGHATSPQQTAASTSK